MKAVVYNKKGSPEKLIYCDIARPLPTDNEVLVKVWAVSVNAADYRSMQMGIIPKKKIFGADIAGVVESAGKNITRFIPGDEVLGDIASYGFGGFAEYVAVPEQALIKKPSKISFGDAATLPMASITALQALRDIGKIRKGQKVLIAGSSGGVGTFAVQLARFFEAEVTGVCSTRKIQQTLSLGADYAIDYTKEYFPESGRQYNLILAINGNYPIIACKRVLTPGGIYIMVGGSLWQIFNAIMFGRVLSIGTRKMRTLAAKANINDLEFLAKLLENGIIKPVIDRRYTLDRSADAMRYVSEGHSHGKVLIIVVPE